MPPKETAIDILAEAIIKIKSNPMSHLFGRGVEVGNSKINFHFKYNFQTWTKMTQYLLHLAVTRTSCVYCATEDTINLTPGPNV